MKPEEPPYRNPSPPTSPMHHVCPLHPQEELDKREADTRWGNWEYFKCPVRGCFVCCGAHQVDTYIPAVTDQLQDFFRRLPLTKMKCFCSHTLSHTQFRKKPRPPLLQMRQVRVRFLPVGQRRPQEKHTSLVGRGKVHDPVQWSSGETQTPRCLMGNPPAKMRARDRRQVRGSPTRHHHQGKILLGEKGAGSLRGQLASRRSQTIPSYEKTG